MNNREIKFRVWNSKTKNWVHGPGKEVNLFGEMILLGGFMPVKIEELNDCVALQFTGLKDKNKKDIYEGDFLEISEEDQQKYYKPHCHVWFSEFSGSWVVSFNHLHSETSRDLYMVHRTYSVVGNVMENPDFLK